MKIAVATNNYKNVVGHVGRCKGFILYEVENGVIKNRKEIENPFAKEAHNHSHRGGHHGRGREGRHHNHNELITALEGSEVLLCKHAGWGLIHSLNESGIKTLFTDERFGDDAVKKLERNEPEFTDPLEEV